MIAQVGGVSTEIEVNERSESETEEITEVTDTNKSHYTISIKKLEKSIQKFEESLRFHAEKTQTESEVSEEEESVQLLAHFSDSDRVDNDTQDVLNALDRYDDSGHVANWNNNVITKRIQKLVEKAVGSMRVN